MVDVILGIMKRAIEARHPIQNKFAHLHGRIIEIKEKNKRVFAYENALNFTGSISPIRVPEFEADLGQLSRISSPPAGIEELQRKYVNIEEISRDDDKNNDKDDYKHDDNDDKDTKHNEYEQKYAFNESNYSMDAFKFQEPPKTPTKSPKKTNLNVDKNNFPAVISPMKRPHKEIEAEGKGNVQIRIVVNRF